MSDEDTERRWREAVRKQQEDDMKAKTGPYGGNYGGSEGGSGCPLIALQFLAFLALALALLLGGCASPAISTATLESVPIQPHGPAGFWTMSWHDEFSSTTLNTKLWSVPAWRINNVTWTKKDVWLYGGNLVLNLSSSTSGGAVLSVNKLKPGMVAEARIMFKGPDGSHVYNMPAWWTVGVKYPDSGEHDIAEGLGKPCVSYWSGARVLAYKTCPAGLWANSWHTYTLERRDRSALVYWDGKLVAKYATSDDGGPEHLILNNGWSPKRSLITGKISRMFITDVRVFTH
jgi:hypothetical protein